LVEVLALSLSPNIASNFAIKAFKSYRRGDDVSRMGANHAVAILVSRVATNPTGVVSTK
jgi:hypothetical protein